MPRMMIDAHGRILCYGNPAGYVSGDSAIVDTMFQTAELSTFLAGRGLEASWRDGVYDRLILSSGHGPDGDAAPLKDCRIWQLGTGTPVEMRFIDYASLIQRYGEPDPDNYVQVYDGQLETNDLEEIFIKFNADSRPPGYTGHALSISDVVELYDDRGSEFFYCDRVGFRQISFGQQEQVQDMELHM